MWFLSLFCVSFDSNPVVLLGVQEVGEDSKKKEGSMAGPSPLWLGDELEFWPEKASGVPMRYENSHTSMSVLAVPAPGF